MAFTCSQRQARPSLDLSGFCSATGPTSRVSDSEQPAYWPQHHSPQSAGEKLARLITGEFTPAGKRPLTTRITTPTFSNLAPDLVATSKRGRWDIYSSATVDTIGCQSNTQSYENDGVSHRESTESINSHFTPSKCSRKIKRWLAVLPGLKRTTSLPREGTKH